MTREERTLALVNNLRQYDKDVQAYFQLESEDVPIVLSVLENLEKIEQIVKRAESLHPEIAIGDREAISRISEVIHNE